jgi:hypothetical protein
MTLADLIADAPALSAGVAALTFAVAIGTFVKAILEYRRQNAVKRFDKFQEINKRFDESPVSEIRFLLEDDNPKLKDIAYTAKHDFLGLYEEVAIMVTSKIMRMHVAYYMYGYYAIRCFNSRYFWMGDNAPDRDSVYWHLFATFAKQMAAIEEERGNLPIDPRKLRF